MNPPDPNKSPFSDLRQVIPIRLATDSPSVNGRGVGAARRVRVRPESEYSTISSPGDSEDSIPKT